MDSSSIPMPAPSENPFEAFKRKLRVWSKRLLEWTRRLFAFALMRLGRLGGFTADWRNSGRHASGWRQRSVLWMAAAALLGLAIWNERVAPENHGSLWRVLIALAGFLYLWWLAAMVFDLVFVWHRYIQADAALGYLRKHVQPRSYHPRHDPPPMEHGPGFGAKLPPSTPRSGGPAKPFGEYDVTNIREVDERLAALSALVERLSYRTRPSDAQSEAAKKTIVTAIAKVGASAGESSSAAP